MESYNNTGRMVTFFMTSESFEFARIKGDYKSLVIVFLSCNTSIVQPCQYIKNQQFCKSIPFLTCKYFQSHWRVQY